MAWGLPSGVGQQVGNAAVIGAGQRAGYFSPGGSPAIMAATRRQALRSADNMRRRSAILSRLMGLDPNQARVAAVGADTAASGQTAEALNAAQYGQLTDAQNFLRCLYMGQQDFENQKELAKYQSQLNQPSLGGMIGGALGTAGGAFLGGYGTGLGQRRNAPVQTGPYIP
jgi:hypothetical protein